MTCELFEVMRQNSDAEFKWHPATREQGRRRLTVPLGLAFIAGAVLSAAIMSTIGRSSLREPATPSAAPPPHATASVEPRIRAEPEPAPDTVVNADSAPSRVVVLNPPSQSAGPPRSRSEPTRIPSPEKRAPSARGSTEPPEPQQKAPYTRAAPPTAGSISPRSRDYSDLRGAFLDQ